MSGRLAGSLLLALALGSSACLIVDNDEDDPSNGGNPSNGGGTPSNGGNSNGGSPGVGGSGGFGEAGSTGNQGGGPLECDIPTDCPEPEFYCTDQTCAEGVCGEQYSAAGTLCGDDDDFVCDADGFCVECLDDTDCPGNDICDVAVGICYNPDTTGDCADTFCVGGQADNTCFTCMQSAGGAGGDCQTEYAACVSDPDGGSCTTCLERFMGQGGTFCAGSQDKYDDVFDCICDPGVCLD